jgi:arylsulfatase A-like enzyme
MPDTDWTKGLGSYAVDKKQYSNDLFAREAAQFITRNRNNLFFLYLALTGPHINNEAPDGEKCEAPDTTRYADKKWNGDKKRYASSISVMDDYVGSLLDLLDQLSLDEKTLVIFTSDNGPEAGMNKFFNGSGPLRGHKRDLYEGGIRIPFIARWPGKIKTGMVTDHISGFQDFLPTACEIVGIEMPVKVDGISYLPALLGQDQEEHAFMYFEFHELSKSQSIRTGDWKAVRLNVWENPNGPLELYNLKSDLPESKNLAESHPDIVVELDSLMKAAHLPDPNWPLFRNELTGSAE